MERTMASLSMRRAVWGSSSEIRMPGTFVPMALNAELALGSQVSTWLGPPSSQSRMHAWALPPAPWMEAARRYCSRWMPRKPREPTLRKSRRLAFIVMTPLMILREFARAKHRPDELFPCRLPIRAGGDQVLDAGRLRLLGKTREGSQVKLVDDFRVRFARLEQPQ